MVRNNRIELFPQLSRSWRRPLPQFLMVSASRIERLPRASEARRQPLPHALIKLAERTFTGSPQTPSASPRLDDGFPEANESSPSLVVPHRIELCRVAFQTTVPTMQTQGPNCSEANRAGVSAYSVSWCQPTDLIEPLTRPRQVRPQINDGTGYRHGRIYSGLRHYQPQKDLRFRPLPKIMVDREGVEPYKTASLQEKPGTRPPAHKTFGDARPLPRRTRRPIKVFPYLIISQRSYPLDDVRSGSLLGLRSH